MFKNRRFVAISATALLGAAVLAGCSSSTESDAERGAAAAEPGAGESGGVPAGEPVEGVLAPVIVEAGDQTANAKVGDYIVFIDFAVETEFSTEPSDLLKLIKAPIGGPYFLPAAVALKAGDAIVTGTFEEGDYEPVTITITEPAAPVVKPIVVDIMTDEVEVEVGDFIEFDVKGVAGTTISTDEPGLLALIQPRADLGEKFNPGAKALASGVAVVTVTNPDKSMRLVTIIINEPAAPVVKPIVVDIMTDEVEVEVGDFIVFNVMSLAGTTISTDEPGLLALTQAKAENGVEFNPSAEALDSGVAVVTVTSDESTREVKIIIAE